MNEIIGNCTKEQLYPRRRKTSGFLAGTQLMVQRLCIAKNQAAIMVALRELDARRMSDVEDYLIMLLNDRTLDESEHAQITKVILEIVDEKARRLGNDSYVEELFEYNNIDLIAYITNLRTTELQMRLEQVNSYGSEVALSDDIRKKIRHIYNVIEQEIYSRSVMIRNFA